MMFELVFFLFAAVDSPPVEEFLSTLELDFLFMFIYFSQQKLPKSTTSISGEEFFLLFAVRRGEISLTKIFMILYLPRRRKGEGQKREQLWHR
jgi:hypothetical protein